MKQFKTCSVFIFVKLTYIKLSIVFIFYIFVHNITTALTTSLEMLISWEQIRNIFHLLFFEIISFFSGMNDSSYEKGFGLQELGGEDHSVHYA